MPTDVQRNLGPGVSNSLSYEAVGNAEDLTPILFALNPKRTMFLSNFGTADDAKATSADWFTEPLRPPQMNAHYEYEEYKFDKIPSVEGLSNYIQHFQNTGYISDTARKIKKAYAPDSDEFARAITRAFTDQGNDIEYMLVSNGTKRQETPGSLPALSGGVPYFMQVNHIECTASNSDNMITMTNVTKTKPSGLQNGDFVTIIGDTLPTGISADKMYYVRFETSSNEDMKKIKLYHSLAGAVEGIAGELVEFSDNGSNLKLVTNNVISLGGNKDFTLEDINMVMQMAMRRGGEPNMAYMSLHQKKRFSDLINANIQAQRPAGSKPNYVDAAFVYEGDFGTIEAKAHPMYPENRLDILDMQYWENKWLERTHQTENLARTGTYEKYVIESKLMLQGLQPKASCSIINIKR